jgi:archaeosortase B (VPXXXP-CTERM-specific)
MPGTRPPKKARSRRQVPKNRRSGHAFIKPTAYARIFWNRHRIVIRSLLIFIVAIGAFQAIIDGIGYNFWQYVMSWTARMTAWGLSAIGFEAQADGRFVNSSLLDVEVIRECTAVHPILIFAAAVLAHPCGWKPKLLGIGLGIPTLLLINVVRMVSLCFVGNRYPDSFETIHLLVWQSLIIFLTVLIWILWAVIINSHGKHIFKSA